MAKKKSQARIKKKSRAKTGRLKDKTVPLKKSAAKAKENSKSGKKISIAPSVRPVVEILKDNKAQDIVILDFRQEAFFSDHFVIATGLSETHLQTLMSAVLKHASQNGIVAMRRKADAGSGWLLADLGDTIVHLFLKETRERYDLENLWNDVKRTEAH